jgi:hypothetical protein
VSESGIVELSQDDQCGTESVSIANIKFNAIPPHGEPENSTAEASSAIICTSTQLAGVNSQRCRDVKTVVDKMTCLTNFQVIKELHIENPNLTHNILKTTLVDQEP